MASSDVSLPSQSAFVRDWMLTSAIGLLATIPALTLPTLPTAWQIAAPLLTALAVGLLLGGAQWLVLRHYFDAIAIWVAATLGGALVGGALGMVSRNVLVGVLSGMIVVTLAQWWVLRSRVDNAYRWLVASGLGWALTAVAAAIAGLITSTVAFDIMMAQGGDPGPLGFLADQPVLVLLIGLAAIVVTIYPVLFMTGQAMWRFLNDRAGSAALDEESP